MKCFNHNEVDAVGICNYCNKGICKLCIISNEYNIIACSTSCLEEVVAYRKMTDKAKMAYGLKAGRSPVTIIFMGAAGLLFTVFGVLTLIGGGTALGVFTLGIGIISIITAFFYWLNQKKSGIRV